ncbi:MAG: YbbR-like domain-containing protein [Prevotellaceae bacterium]|jgi:hypothetical protein|nr:YbbR-like domain-containing protein [Prevotellaceae bacterium]
MDKKAPLPQTLLGARRLFKRDKQLLVFGVFLLTSAALWTLNKLSHTYTAEISAKMLLTETRPIDAVLTNGRVSPLRLRVQARGYDIVRYKLFYSKTFRVNLGMLRYFENSEGQSVLLTGQVRGMIAQQLGTNFDVQAILPDSVYFQMSPVASKKVPVALNFHIAYARQYMQQGEIILDTDSVVVSGPREVVDATSEIYTKPLKKEKVAANLSGKVMLEAPPQTFLSREYISYHIDVQRVTQITRRLPIHIIGVPDSLYVELIPANAKIFISIAMEEYHRIKQEELFLTAYYSELHQSISGQVRVTLSKPPAYMLSTSIEPAFVNVIVRQRR